MRVWKAIVNMEQDGPFSDRHRDYSYTCCSVSLVLVEDSHILRKPVLAPLKYGSYNEMKGLSNNVKLIKHSKVTAQTNRSGFCALFIYIHIFIYYNVVVSVYIYSFFFFKKTTSIVLFIYFPFFYILICKFAFVWILFWGKKCTFEREKSSASKAIFGFCVTCQQLFIIIIIIIVFCITLGDAEYIAVYIFNDI